MSVYEHWIHNYNSAPHIRSQIEHSTFELIPLCILIHSSHDSDEWFSRLPLSQTALSNWAENLSRIHQIWQRTSHQTTTAIAVSNGYDCLKIEGARCVCVRQRVCVCVAGHCSVEFADDEGVCVCILSSLYRQCVRGIAKQKLTSVLSFRFRSAVYVNGHCEQKNEEKFVIFRFSSFPCVCVLRSI